MTLPAPAWTQARLDAWFAAVPLEIPLPPGEPESWTCLLREIGFPLLSRRDDRCYSEYAHAEMLRALLAELGRPVTEDEPDPILLSTPIPSGAALVEALRRVRHHSSYIVRASALFCLSVLDPAEARGALLDGLGDSDNDVRRAAVECLGRTGDPSVAATLAPLLDDHDDTVTHAVALAWLRLGAWDVMAEAVEEAEDASEGVLSALRALLAAESGDESGLREHLEGGVDGLSRLVCVYLAARPERAAAWVETLIEVLRGEDEPEAPFLEAIAAGGEETLELLAPLLTDDNWQVRMNAAAALAFCPDVGALAPALGACLTDHDSDVVREAALACVIHGVEPAFAASRLMGASYESRGFPGRINHVAARGAPLGPLAFLSGASTVPIDALLAFNPEGAASRMRGWIILVAALGHPKLAGPSAEALALGRASAPLYLRRYAAAACFLVGHAPGAGVGHRLLLAHQGSISVDPDAGAGELTARAAELAAVAALDPSWEVRLDAIRLLRKLGVAAAPYEALLDAIATRDSDADCRKAATARARTWRLSGLESALASLLVPESTDNTDARAADLAAIFHQDRALGLMLGRQLALSDDRNQARSAARLVGSKSDPADLPALAGTALARLGDGSWIRREVACDLLGAMPPASLDTALREEIVEALTARADDDDDNDVRVAARAAAQRLSGASA